MKELGGKTVKGESIKLKNRLNLSEYKKMFDPTTQQAIAAAARINAQRGSGNMLDPNVDPYKAFKRHLIRDASELSRTLNQQSTQRSKSRMSVEDVDVMHSFHANGPLFDSAIK